MKILIEGYQYNSSDVRNILTGLDFLENANQKIVVNHVGYKYNPNIQDCIFILPKVLIDKDGKVFNQFEPAEIIDVSKWSQRHDTFAERNFLYEFAVWIYRALYVFKANNPDSNIVFYKHMTQVGSSNRHLSNTYLEVLLALVDFNKMNQDYFTTVIKNLHLGFNKINWTRTVSHSKAIIQNQTPLYINPVNKKRKINFDEELLIIYFSILKFVNERYGFPVKLNFGFELIPDSKFENYLNGYGKVRLLQIKYKYFADKALYLWDLCFAFFEKSEHISVSSDLQEYLIAKNFNIVFEAIIDDLVGDSREEIPERLIDQPDGKKVDHIYRYKSLVSNDDTSKSMYYIGDSKYYSIGNKISHESVYKQFTYAKNIIQYNIDSFLENNDKASCWRDDLTEGYNVIPNFFISSRIAEDLSYVDDIFVTGEFKSSSKFV